MKYVEAFSPEFPNEYHPQPGEVSLFLGGGITGCENWQAIITAGLKNNSSDDLVVLNPRRANWPMNDPEASTKQIDWEYRHLKLATMIMFWFAPETLCPITLFEYGKWLVGNKPLFVGCHPDYKRKLDVEVQTKLERPFQKVFSSLDEMLGSVLLFDRS
jgi:hypothetical protein